MDEDSGPTAYAMEGDCEKCLEGRGLMCLLYANKLNTFFFTALQLSEILYLDRLVSSVKCR